MSRLFRRRERASVDMVHGPGFGTHKLTSQAAQSQPPVNHEAEVPLSVYNHDQFASRHMTQLDPAPDVKELQVFHWKLNRWSELGNRVESPEFACGGHRWKILLLPRGQGNPPEGLQLSVYLKCISVLNATLDAHACAQFALAMSNMNDPKVFFTKCAHHRFIAQEEDWGFTRYIEPVKLQTIQLPHTRSILDGDSVEISAFVQVFEDPTGVLWHSFVNYDSKVTTGFVGLKNQGATDYLNVMMQALYCTNAFRRAIYEVPTRHDSATVDIVQALQRIFYDLQSTLQPVTTTVLTRAFGWRSLDSFMSHDIMEFKRVLAHKLVEQLRRTSADGIYNRLFIGKIRTYIKCVNIPFQSSRTEDFEDLMLNVKGISSLRASFQDHNASYRLDGDMKYSTERYGLQVADKGVHFDSFPPVLWLQLKRYEYTVGQDAMIKVHDRFEYPPQIDLREFLSPSADQSQSWVYTLTGVVVHSGNLTGGHYYCYLKPSRETRWLKFDDDRVTPASDREVFADNFGGTPLDGQTQKLTSAYVLVYMREDKMDELLAPISENDVPFDLKNLFDNGSGARAATLNSLTVKVVTAEAFANNNGFDLVNFHVARGSITELPRFVVPKTETYASLKQRIAREFGMPVEQMRLWNLSRRQNKTVRPDTVISDEYGAHLSVEKIRSDLAARSAQLIVYMEVVHDQTRLDPPADHITIFLKYFDVMQQRLRGVFRLNISRASRLDVLPAIINERMMWAPSKRLKLYEEIKPGMIDSLKMDRSFAQQDIQTGDIICFQDEEAPTSLGEGFLTTAPEYYDLLQSRFQTVQAQNTPAPNSDENPAAPPQR
ncbi:hypothetical protein BKA62DRAFT_706491 [Auriculariales sp. MPI-PUGE-AT-0066]|nr:hypothetical protein BKA62DRAFT_706491 [Auriculariales sp. MPI-PUGE-AT-0066]